MASRIASVLVTLPLLISMVWIGSPWFSLLVGMAAAVVALELSGMARRWGDRPVAGVALAWTLALMAAAHFAAEELSTWERALPAVSVAAGLSLLWLLWHSHRRHPPSTWGATAAVAIFAGGFLFHALPLRAIDQGREWVIFLVLVTFATDTCAYLVGRAVGKRPLAPLISPSKTLEGAMGGLAGALAAGPAAIALLSLDATLVEGLALGALLGTVGQLGDLAESRLKRNAGVKDSGWLLPGHGGLLDSLDSIVPNLVVVYYFVS